MWFASSILLTRLICERAFGKFGDFFTSVAGLNQGFVPVRREADRFW
jgi:hypothetical protein